MIAFTQTRTITGKVLDSSGNPLAGVNVLVKSSNRSTITDSNGYYKITIGTEDKVLVFSMVGYSTINEKIGERTVINVTMKEEAVALDEMVVTGYGSKKGNGLQIICKGCTLICCI